MAREFVILVAGPMGAGKTTAIASLSEIPVVRTEAANTDLVANSKSTTTVALDYGEIALADGDRVRLYGVPGQERFEFMWQILARRAIGLVVLVDATAEQPARDLDRYLASFLPLMRVSSVVVGATRSDLAPQYSSQTLRDVLERHGATMPLFEVDAREPRHMRALLFTLVAMIEAHVAPAAGCAQVGATA
jgi:signal recognition particle receptor subunit beta